MTTRARIKYGAAALVATRALAASATSASKSASMRAATPVDARSADLQVATTTVPRSRIQARRASTYRIGRTGPVVRVGASRTRQFTDFQTFTVVPPSGRQVFQGFATISGGNAGVARILSTQVVRGRYVVRVSYPGDQGTPGRLVLRVQSFPNEG